MIIEQYFPLFEEGRILKKEALEQLRDYASDFAGVMYQGFGNGVIEGFRIRQCADGIQVGAGILKDGDTCFVMKEPVKLAYVPDKEPMFVVLRRQERLCRPDYWLDRYCLELLPQRELQPGEYELGRFCIEKGARLRTEEAYLNISDAATEYNTLNLIHVKAACEGGSCLCPVIPMLYAKDILNSSNAGPIDISFAMACLSGRRLSAEFLWSYLSIRCADTLPQGKRDNLSCYDLLLQLYNRLAQGKRGSRPHGLRSGKTMID